MTRGEPFTEMTLDVKAQEKLRDPTFDLHGSKLTNRTVTVDGADYYVLPDETPEQAEARVRRVHAAQTMTESKL